jgi:hypothetical protein
MRPRTIVGRPLRADASFDAAILTGITRRRRRRARDSLARERSLSPRLTTERAGCGWCARGAAGQRT